MGPANFSSSAGGVMSVITFNSTAAGKIHKELDGSGGASQQPPSAAIDTGVTLGDGSSMTLSLDFFDPFLGPKFGHFAALPFADHEASGMFEPLEGVPGDSPSSEDIAFSFASLGDASLYVEEQQVPPLLSAGTRPLMEEKNIPGPAPQRRCSPRIVRPAMPSKHCFIFTEAITARLARDCRSRPGQDAVALPEAGALQKCLSTYIDGFHVHFPLIHLPTLDLETASTPLILAMCAVGAQYRLEHKIAVTLYVAAQHALASAKIDLDQIKTSWAALPQGWAKPRSRPSRDISQSSLALMQARWMVTFFEAFSGQPQLIRQALIDCSHISADLRMNRMLVSSGSSTLDHSTWASWARRESLKRLLCGSMILNNLLSVAFGVGLGFDLVEESNIELPVDDALWEAPTATAWEAAAGNKALGIGSRRPRSRRLALRSFRGTKGTRRRVLGVVAIRHVRRDARRCPVRVLPPTGHPGPQCKRPAREQSGRRVTYGRAFMGDRCMDRSLLYMDCHEDMLAVMRRYLETNLERNELLTMAVARSLKSFSIPIKSGLVLMRKTAALTSSIEHTLAGWDAALLVTKWTHTIECAQNSGQTVTPSESQTLNSVCELLTEVDINCSQARSIAAEVARIWAGLYDDTWVWGVAPRIGWVLRELAHMYDQETGGGL